MNRPRLLITTAMLALALGASAWAQSTFELRFDDKSARAVVTGVPGKAVEEPEVPPTLTRENHGAEGEAAIIAGEALEAFEPVSGGEVKALHGLRYFCPEALNSQSGEIRLRFRPHYNGSYTTPSGSSSPQRLYYLFDSGRFDPEKETERIGGIQILIKHVKGESGDTYMLNVSLALANGEAVKLARPVAATPDQWHSLKLSWTETEVVLDFDERPLQRREIQGPLAGFNEFFTLGGSWYGTWPLQGLLDEVHILGH